MATARREVVTEGVGGYYHCISRCVRRAFLCGLDAYSGRSYEHRKEWVQSLLRHLAGLFGLEVCAYTVMSNHLHVVLRTRPDWVESWSDEEIVRRWRLIFNKGHSKADGLAATDDKASSVPGGSIERLAVMRSRLSSVSWFMRCVNETIARRVNREDECKGRFWEGRFKCQALLDEAAILTCMAYVDLNPIRAGIAETPEESEHTSVHDRIQRRERDLNSSIMGVGFGNDNAANGSKAIRNDDPQGWPSDQWLCPLGEEVQAGPGLSLTTDEYLDLVDWTGRQMRSDKSGAIPAHLSPILTRLAIKPDRWAGTVKDYGRRFHLVAGAAASVMDLAKRLGKLWLSGIHACREAFASA